MSCSIYYINTNELLNHFISLFHLQFFNVKCAIYYVVIATVIFSDVKVTCYFHM